MSATQPKSAVDRGAPLRSQAASPREEEEEGTERRRDDAKPEQLDEVAGRRSKKKRRVIKPTDKKYECPQPECGKSYSRAEHLYRHQLNHTPKQIYRCDFPGCDRNFVRADLCARHKERHTAKGSHLQRKDAFMHSHREQQQQQQQQQQAGANAGATRDAASTTSTETSPVDSAHPALRQPLLQDSTIFMNPSIQQNQHQYTTADGEQPYPDPSHHQRRQAAVPGGPNGVESQLAANASYNTYPDAFHHGGPSVDSSSMENAVRRFSVDSQMSRPGTMTNGHVQPLPMHPPPLSAQQPPSSMYAQPYQTQAQGNGGGAQQYQTPSANTSLPLYPTPYNVQNTMTASETTAGYSYQMTNGGPDASMPDLDFFGHDFGSGHVISIFDPAYSARLPNNYGFMNILDNDRYSADEPSPEDSMQYAMQTPVNPPKMEAASPWPKELSDTNAEGDKSPGNYTMDNSMKESEISTAKQKRLLGMVQSWQDVERLPGREGKSIFLSHTSDEKEHPMSEDMLKTYLTSFWIHIHQQMPIMHRPSFNGDTCPDLLLLTMMCLGACCLDRTHSSGAIKAAAELSFFCAYHIRWEIFKEPDFRPTAKMWTFQTLLLLELFEKMYSTRALHERAHVHHATTLAVMRRGSSLIGRGAADEAYDDPTRTPPGPEGTINLSGQNTSDPWWNKWISKEAALRIAYAAFIIDSTHAAMFGHAAIMTATDLRLPLPCDEHVWAARSGAEVQGMEASLIANGFARPTFHQGLEKMLRREPVKTNVFGRIVLMAGLLNLSWQMNSRDLQASSLQAGDMIGTPDKWRIGICRAFDHWKKDFDLGVVKVDGSNMPPEPTVNKSMCHRDHKDNVFESNVCLHSLAHMSMYITIAQCEVYAGADLALGRRVVDSDRADNKDEMLKWAKSDRGRDAVQHAIRFLRETLIPHAGTSNDRRFTYSARDDYLLNRPYVLYFACMIVWAYGYAVEGPLPESDFRPLTTEEQLWDMSQLLLSPTKSDNMVPLEGLKNRNRVVGLLILMRDCFSSPRWEILQESARLLDRCLELICPGINEQLRVSREKQEYEEQQQQQQQHQQHYQHYQQIQTRGHRI